MGEGAASAHTAGTNLFSRGEQGSSGGASDASLPAGAERWVARAGAVGGADLYVHLLLPAVVALEAVAYAIAGGPAGFVLGLLLGITLFATVLIHELGHAAMARRVGGSCRRITLWPLGGLAECDTNGAGHAARLKVALAGPATHVPMAGFLLLLQLACGGASVQLRDVAGWDNLLCNWLAGGVVMQVSLLCFNLLPAYPLDGGRVLASALLMRGLPAQRAARWTCYVAAPIACAVSALGVYSVVTGGSNGILTLFVGAWMATQVLVVWQLQAAGRAEAHPLFAPEMPTHPSPGMV